MGSSWSVSRSTGSSYTRQDYGVAAGPTATLIRGGDLDGHFWPGADGQLSGEFWVPADVRITYCNPQHRHTGWPCNELRLVILLRPDRVVRNWEGRGG